MKLATATRPVVLFVLPLLLSAAAWMVPGNSAFLRGFNQRADLTLGGFAILIAWYSLCLFAFLWGSRMGAAVLPFDSISRAENSLDYEKTFLKILTAAATIGVAYALFLAQQEGSILASLAQSSGNDLSAPLKEGTGVGTLRYTTVISAPFALALWLRRRSAGLFVVWNLLLLLLSSLFSSRMSLLMAIVVFVFLYARSNPGVRIKPLPVIVAGCSIFGVLGALNFFRNANYYALNDVDNPVLMNWYQILTYLGAPFQASGGVASAIFSGTFPSRGTFIDSLAIMTPTFFHEKNLGSIIDSHARYANQVDVAGNLTTNSAFADTYDALGVWGLIWSLLAFIIAGVIYGHCRQYKSGMALAAGLSLYLIAEYWRIFLFNQGIVVYLFLAIFVGSALAVWLTSTRLDDKPAKLSVGAQPAASSLLKRSS